MLLMAVAPAAADEIQVVKSGKYYGTVEAYRIGDHYYLGAKEAASLYGGSLYWHAVRGAVQLSFRGRPVSFQEGSREVLAAGRKSDMPRPMIVRVSRAFIPIEFFTGKVFADIAGVDSRFNPKTKLLLVDQRSSVGPLRWFTYPDHTRVVLEVGEDLRYLSARRGRYGFEVTLPNGSIDWSEKIPIDDGVLDFLHLHQDAKQARLTLRLQDGAGEVKLLELKKPRRIVLDVARAAGAPAAAAGSAATEFSRPPAPPGTPAPAAGASGAAAAAPSPKARFRITIDAGHGGKDGGAVGRRGTLEKDINLSAARELAALLQEEGYFEVLLTRTGDSFVPLDDRARMANDFRSDLFISIHSNANESRRESGFEVYFLSERASDPEAERLAEFENSVLALEGKEASGNAAADLLYALARTEFINDAAELAGLMTQAVGRRVDLPNRGVKQAAFYVLRGVHAPAVLVEMGFLTNARDEAKLQSDKYREKIVEGVYAGVLDFARRKAWVSGTAAR